MRKLAPGLAIVTSLVLFPVACLMGLRQTLAGLGPLALAPIGVGLIIIGAALVTGTLPPRYSHTTRTSRTRRNP